MNESYRVIKQYNNSNKSDEYKLLNQLFGYTKREALEVISKDIEQLNSDSINYPFNEFIIYKLIFLEEMKKRINKRKGLYL